jgi:heptosyltransferase-3
METFLICHRGALGDFILTWPTLYHLKKALPQYRFLGIGRAEYMQLAKRFGLLDDYRDRESKAAYDFFYGRSLPSDMTPPAGAVLWLSDGDDAARLLKKTAALPVVTITPFPQINYHVARYYCSMVSEHFPLAVPDDCAIPLQVPEESGEYALIHPGSGGVAKNYSAELYYKIADLLRQKKHRKVGFVLGPVERERNSEIEYSGEWVIKPDNVNELTDLLIGTSLYIGNDSGASHLSAILGTPTITLYKSTDPKVWGTIGKSARHIVGDDEAVVLEMVQGCLENGGLEYIVS